MKEVFETQDELFYFIKTHPIYETVEGKKCKAKFNKTEEVECCEIYVANRYGYIEAPTQLPIYSFKNCKEPIKGCKSVYITDNSKLVIESLTFCGVEDLSNFEFYFVGNPEDEISEDSWVKLLKELINPKFEVKESVRESLRRVLKTTSL